MMGAVVEVDVVGNVDRNVVVRGSVSAGDAGDATRRA